MIKFTYKLVVLVLISLSLSCSKDDDSQDNGPVVEGRIIINYNNNQDVFETIIGGTHQEACYEPGDNVFTLSILNDFDNIEVDLILTDINPNVDAFASNSTFPIYGFARGGNGIYGTFQFKKNGTNYNLSDGTVVLTNVSPVITDEIGYENAYYLSATFTLQDSMGYEISGELDQIIYRSVGCD